jgi:hypothetical protein
MYETLRKMSFCTKGYAKIHIQRSLLDNKKNIGDVLVTKIQILSTFFGPIHTKFLEGIKNQNLNFGGIPKFPKLMVFGQILAGFGRFCYIGNG